MKSIHSLLNVTGRSAGLTLAELLITLSLVALVALPTGWALIQSIGFFDTVSRNYGFLQTSRIAMTGIREVLLEARRIVEVDTETGGDEGFMEVRRLIVEGVGQRREEIRVDETGRLYITEKEMTGRVYLMMKPLDGSLTNCRGVMLRVMPYSGDSPAYSEGTQGHFLEDRVYFRNAE